MNKHFHGHNLISGLTFISLIITLILIAKISSGLVDTQMPKIAFIFMASWLSLATIFSLITFKDFVTGFLVTAFSMMTAWRIAAIYDIHTITYPLFIIFILMLINFIYCAWINLRKPHRFLYELLLERWQLIFIRIYLGLDFIPHFAEKLFAGPGPHAHIVDAFTQLGVPNPNLFVWIAGFCELGAAIALGLGFLMRLGAAGAALYLIIATYLGHHFSLGFTWVGPGGGWEFATMWIILILSFAFSGAHEFSIDQRLEDTFKLPKFIKKLM